MTGSGLIMLGRQVRHVSFQTADGVYPATAHEVTDGTWANCYSTSSRDKRGFIGSFLVGNVPAIHNEIDSRQKGTAWMNVPAVAVAEVAEMAEVTPEPMPIGPRGTVHFTPGMDGHGSSRTFRRTINGRHFSFNVVNMPNGDVRLFVSVYNGYGDRDVALFGMTQAEADERGMRWGCAWTHLHSITIKAPVRPFTASYVVNEAGSTTLRDARPMVFDDGRMVTAQVTGPIAAVFVGLALHHDGPMPAGMVPGSPDFYAWCREIAAAGERKGAMMWPACQRYRYVSVAGDIYTCATCGADLSLPPCDVVNGWGSPCSLRQDCHIEHVTADGVIFYPAPPVPSTFATIVFGQPHRVTVAPDQSGVDQGRYRVADVIDGRLMIVPASHLHPVNA
jgi:hypothetical protein